jgi:hypothetical protein
MRVPEGPIPLSSVVCMALACEKGHCRKPIDQFQRLPGYCNLAFNVNDHLVRQAGKPGPQVHLTPPLAVLASHSSDFDGIHHRRLYPKCSKTTAIRSQMLLDPRKPSCHCRCSPYAAYHPLCSMYEILCHLPCPTLTRYIFQIPKLTGKRICTKSKSISMESETIPLSQGRRDP